MAVTRLSDAIIPEVFNPYMMKETTTKSAIFDSGILRTDEKLAADLAGGGTTFQVPFWTDLDTTESGVANDDPSSVAVPGKIGARKMRAIRQYRTRGWSDADLVSALAGSNPMEVIGGRVAKYWRDQFQSGLVNSLRGIFADNIANDSSDMVYDATANANAEDQVISADTIIEA